MIVLDSTTNRNHESGRGVEEYLMRCAIAEAIAGTMVEPAFGLAQVSVDYGGEVKFLREVLTQ